MENTFNPELTFTFITLIVALAVSVYFYYCYNRTYNRYKKNIKELIKVKEELIETKTELIRKVDTVRGLDIENKFLGATCAKSNKILSKKIQNLASLYYEIQSIERRISIKDLEAFKQRCAEIYSETETA